MARLQQILFAALLSAAAARPTERRRLGADLDLVKLAKAAGDGELGSRVLFNEGTCVDDASWRHYSRGRERDNRDCAWLDGRDSKSRCDRYKDGAGVRARDACCACDQYYAPAPTPAPTPLGFCVDDDDWRLAKKGKTKKNRGCEWIANKGASKSRCKSKDIDGVRASQACGCVCSEFN